MKFQVNSFRYGKKVLSESTTTVIELNRLGFFLGYFSVQFDSGSFCLRKQKKARKK